MIFIKLVEEMKEKYFTRYVLENGKMKKIKINREEALKEMDELLKKDKDFLDIMAKM